MLRTMRSRVITVLLGLLGVFLFAVPVLGLSIKSNKSHSYWYITLHWWEGTGIFLLLVVVVCLVVGVGAWLVDWCQRGEVTNKVEK